MDENRKRKNIIIIVCTLAGICLAGAAVFVIVSVRRNPLAKGLAGLTKEVAARKEEMGEHFWINAVNRIGSENMQVEYSVNIGGIPELQNITFGLDGKLRRDMAQELLGSEIALSVANAEIAEASFFGTADTLYLQIPSVWEGSVVMDAADLSGQWNGSVVKEGLERLTGQELGIERRLDLRLFNKYYVNQKRTDDLFKRIDENWQALYENMEVVKVQEAQKKGVLEETQAERLGNYVLRDSADEDIMTTCYLVILPEKELREIFVELEGDIRLGVYLDERKRIVRICTLPGEKLITDFWEGEISINLTGAEATIDRMEWEIVGMMDMEAILSGMSNGEDFLAEYDRKQQCKELFVGSELKGNMIIEKNTEARGTYQIQCDAALSDSGENKWALSLEGDVRGEQSDQGEALSFDVERFVLKSDDQVICRASGVAECRPLTEKVEIPAGKKWQIGKMNPLETTLFLAECVKNVFDHFGGYLKLLE